MSKTRNSVPQVRSVGKAMTLIETLLAHRTPMSLLELSTATGYPKSTTHALLSTLREYGMIEQRPNGQYFLGIRLFECGCAVSAAWDISNLIRPYLERLSTATGASAFISSLDGDSTISLDQCAGKAGMQVVPEIGCRLPLHATSQGKLLLSRFSEAEVRKRLSANGMQAYTPHTITNPELFLSALDVIRHNGFAIEDGEYKVGLRSVSAPVRDCTGQVKYALGVVGLFRRIQSEDFQDAITQVRQLAAQLSAALGWRGGSI